MPDAPPQRKRGRPRKAMTPPLAVEPPVEVVKESLTTEAVPLTLAPETAADRLNRRLDFLEDRHFRPSAYPNRNTAAETEELRQYRPHLFPTKLELGGEKAGPIGPDGNELPKYVTNLGVLCGYISHRFAEHNVKVRKQTINKWQAGKGVPSGTPFFPIYDSAGRYELAKVFDWVEKYIVPKCQAQSSRKGKSRTIEEELSIEDLRERDEREALEHARWERDQERGEYVHKQIALATGIAAVRKIHTMVKVEDERSLPKQRRDKLVALGMTPELAAQFEAWDVELGRAVTDKRELAMEEAGKVKIEMKE